MRKILHFPLQWLKILTVGPILVFSAPRGKIWVCVVWSCPWRGAEVPRTVSILGRRLWSKSAPHYWDVFACKIERESMNELWREMGGHTDIGRQPWKQAKKAVSHEEVYS